MKRCVESTGGAGSSKRLERYPPTQNMQHFRPQLLPQSRQLTCAFPRVQRGPQNMFCNKMPSMPYMYNHATPPWNFNGPPPPCSLRPPFPPRSAQSSFPVFGPMPPYLTQQLHPPLEGRQANDLSGTPSQGERVYQTVVNKKPKRKSMSLRCNARMWVREDAVKAIALEEEYSRTRSKAPILILRFPDPELNRDVISKYSPDIVSVHFQQNSAPRYCFVHLREDADVDKTIEAVSKIPFGTGFVSAELKRVPPIPPSNPDDIDPCSLYVGNLPAAISTYTVKSYFPGALRVDVGFAQKMKCTRYAFVWYGSPEEAIEAFRRSVDKMVDSRSLIVRFLRRTTAAVESIAKPDVDGNVSDSDDVTEPNNSASSSVRSVADGRGDQLRPACDTPASAEVPLDDIKVNHNWKSMQLLPEAVKHCQSRLENDELWSNMSCFETAVKQEPLFKDGNEESDLGNQLEDPSLEPQHFKKELKVESRDDELICLGNDESSVAIERYSCPNFSASVTPSPTSSSGEVPWEAQHEKEPYNGEIKPVIKQENDTKSYEGIDSDESESIRGQEFITEVTEEVTYISELYEQLHSTEGRKRSFAQNRTEADRLDELFSDMGSDVE